MNRALEARCVSSKGYQVGEVVGVLKKARRAPVSALDDMDRNVRNNEASHARHGIPKRMMLQFG
jgi:hypothetical protein